MSRDFYSSIAKVIAVFALAIGVLSMLGFSLLSAIVGGIALVCAGVAVAASIVLDNVESHDIQPRKWDDR